MQNSQVLFPAHHDPAFIRDRVGSPSYSYELNEARDQYIYKMLPEDFDKVREAVDAYQVDYLEVLVSMMLAEVSLLRDRKIGSFTFNGMPIPMDAETRGNLGDLIKGLERNPDRAHSTWSLGKGEFVKMPRDVVFALGDAAFNYVQDCFDAHEVVAQAIKDTATVDELLAIDLDQHEAWPIA